MKSNLTKDGEKEEETSHIRERSRGKESDFWSLEDISVSKDSDNEEDNIIISNEGFKSKSIFKDELLLDYIPEYNTDSLFDKKDIIKNSVEKNNFTDLEEMLSLDQTNKKLQIKYLNVAIQKLNSEVNFEKKSILIEKIEKGRVIIDEVDYNNEIEKIADDKLKIKLSYINYKESLKQSIKFVLSNRGIENEKEAKSKLNIRKIFTFNQPAVLGENNYFFYELCIQFFNKINEIYKMYYKIYIDFLEEIFQFLDNKNFDQLSEDDIYKFNYISEYVFDEKSIKNKESAEKAINFIRGQPVEENDLNSVLSDFKSVEYEKTIKYELTYEKLKKCLNFIIKENRRINKKHYKYSSKYSYNINNFNKAVVKIIKQNFNYNFEYFLFECSLMNMNSKNTFYQNIKQPLFSVLRRILSSQAAKNFFNDHYKKKYSDLIYHFDREDVQSKIFEKIQFAPLFNTSYCAYTNPADMSIIINSIPGKLTDPSTPCFNRVILQLGRIIIYALHEILGHYLRRYYSYFTGKKISFLTEGDKEIPTGKEGGDYVEYIFIGYKKFSFLSIETVLNLICDSEYSSYPIIKQDFILDEKKMITIINYNKQLFNFLDIYKLTDEDYLFTIKKSVSFPYSIIHCKNDEQSIEVEEFML